MCNDALTSRGNRLTSCTVRCAELTYAIAAGKVNVNVSFASFIEYTSSSSLLQ